MLSLLFETIRKTVSKTKTYIGMNLQEIAIFKRFIGQHELRKNFIKKYRKSIGMTRNPESVEQYLSNVEPENAITSAVKHFITNEAMGYDFWQSVDMSWQAYLHKMRSSHTIEHEEASTMRGYYSALRENWDKEKSWVYDPISVAQLRYGLISEKEAGLVDEEELPEFPGIEPKYNVGDKLKGKVSGEILEVLKLGETSYIMDDGGVIEYDHQDQWELIPKNGEPLDDSDELEIDFIQLDKTTRISNGLRSGIISVNIRSHSYKVGINRADTKTIKKKQVKYAMVGSLKSGDVVIQFNNNIKGVPILYTSDDYYNINSRQFVENLRRLLSITDDLVYLRFEKLSENLDSITYKVTKQ